MGSSVCDTACRGYGFSFAFQAFSSPSRQVFGILRNADIPNVHSVALAKALLALAIIRDSPGFDCRHHISPRQPKAKPIENPFRRNIEWLAAFDIPPVSQNPSPRQQSSEDVDALL